MTRASGWKRFYNFHLSKSKHTQNICGQILFHLHFHSIRILWIVWNWFGLLLRIWYALPQPSPSQVEHPLLLPSIFQYYWMICCQHQASLQWNYKTIASTKFIRIFFCRFPKIFLNFVCLCIFRSTSTYAHAMIFHRLFWSCLYQFLAVVQSK